MDSDKTIRDAITALEAQEQSITDEYQRLEIRLAQIRTAKAALEALESDLPVEFDGKLADAIRRVLTAIGQRSLPPTEIRDRVKGIGYNIGKHPNQMAAVHSVLHRLVESGEVKTKEWSGSPGKLRYYLAANFETTNVAASGEARNRQAHAAMSSQPLGSPHALLHPEKDKK